MSGFRLQTFLPETDGAEAAASAQKFSERDLERARAEAFEAGYLDGHAAATDSHLKDQSRLTGDLAEALHDARLTNDAARRHVAASLGPMIAAFVEAVVPTLAAEGLAAEVAGRVERAVLALPAAIPRLICAPEVRPAIEALLAARDLAGVVEGNPRLMTREVELHWDEGFDRLDLDACVAQVRACIASYLDPAPPVAEEIGPERE